jgi:hypothetical protein
MTAHSVNTRFSLMRDTGGKSTVVQEIFDVSQCLTAEASTSKVIVTAWQAGDSQSASPIFKFEAPGEKGYFVNDEEYGVNDKVYRVTERGCCGPSDLDRYFSLVNGAAVFAATGHPLKVHVAGNGDRWIAAQDSYSATSIPESESDSAIVGLIQYGDGRTPSMRLAVMHRGGGFYGLDSLYFVRGAPIPDSTAILVTSEDPGPVQVSGFSVVAMFRRVDGYEDDPTLRVEIPIEGDRPRVERARIRGNATLRLVAPQMLDQRPNGAKKR